MRRAHDPSRLGGGRLGRRRDPQQQAGDAGRLRGQRQLAAGDEIELTRLPPDFQHHGPQRIAGQRIGRDAQRALGIPGTHRDETARIEAEFGKPAHRQRTCFEIAKILPHPDQRPPRRDARRKGCDEAGRGRALSARRKHLVHGGERHPAMERRIGLGMAERDAVRQSRA